MSDTHPATPSRLTEEDVLGIISTIEVEHVIGLEHADLMALRDLALSALSETPQKEKYCVHAVLNGCAFCLENYPESFVPSATRDKGDA